MVKLPYGGYDSEHSHMDDDPWKNLETIRHFLEDGEVIPPDLARWLGGAIKASNQDPRELLKGLGLKRRQGQSRGRYPDDYWLVWGEVVWSLHSNGVTKAQAIKKAVEQFSGQPEHLDSITESTMRDWYDKFLSGKYPDRSRNSKENN